MKTWLKYAVGFFSFVVLLTVFIFAFGPGYRAQVKNNESPPFQTAEEQKLVTPGEPPSSK